MRLQKSCYVGICFYVTAESNFFSCQAMLNDIMKGLNDLKYRRKSEYLSIPENVVNIFAISLYLVLHGKS